MERGRGLGRVAKMGPRLVEATTWLCDFGEACLNGEAARLHDQRSRSPSKCGASNSGFHRLSQFF